MTDLDSTAISERIQRIRKSASVLSEALSKGMEAAASDPFTLSAVKYEVQTAAQAALDIGDHIIAAASWEMPKSYADIFRILVQNGVINQELGQRMMGLAKLRNVLVHLYLSVDSDTLYDNLTLGIADLESFCQAIVKFLDSQT